MVQAYSPPVVPVRGAATAKATSTTAAAAAPRVVPALQAGCVGQPPRRTNRQRSFPVQAKPRRCASCTQTQIRMLPHSLERVNRVFRLSHSVSARISGFVVPHSQETSTPVPAPAFTSPGFAEDSTTLKASTVPLRRRTSSQPSHPSTSLTGPAPEPTLQLPRRELLCPGKSSYHGPATASRAGSALSPHKNREGEGVGISASRS
jgi:hypothetical protein